VVEGVDPGIGLLADVTGARFDQDPRDRTFGLGHQRQAFGLIVNAARGGGGGEGRDGGVVLELFTPLLETAPLLYRLVETGGGLLNSDRVRMLNRKEVELLENPQGGLELIGLDPGVVVWPGALIRHDGSMINLQVIIASVRPGRVGLPVAQWFYEFIKEDDRYEVELIDLLEVDLPFMDEPNHPRLGKYTKDHTKAWSERIDSADAFVFVTPEYNYSAPPALTNALSFLNREWSYKAAGFVSYGGVSGGTRSVQVSRAVMNTLSMMTLPGAVNIPFVPKFIDDDGEFQANEPTEKGARAMMDELAKWSDALKPLRA